VAPPLTVVGCYAHPDDETWSVSGSMALLAARGVRCAVWTATRGEAGQITPATGVPPERLGEVREAEERAALALVGVHEVEFGDFRDGAVADADQAELVRAIGSFLRRLRPDVVVTMERGGNTGHPDHMAVSRATEVAFTAYLAEGPDGERPREPRLYQEGVPRSKLAQLRGLATQVGLEFPDEDQPYAPKSAPDELFSCHVDVSSVAELRLRALLEHRTQLAVGTYQLVVSHPEEVRWWLGTESYIRIHPAPRPAERPEASLIEAFAP
jgi:LmbE family N-acetylglucosaminyl deacetylase